MFIKKALKFLSALYIAVITFVTFFPYPSYRGKSNWFGYVRSHCNIIPFKSIVFYIKAVAENTINRGTPLTFFLGALSFIPLGFCFPILSRKARSFGKAILISVLLIALLELLEMATLAGSFDIDSVILRTICASFGYFLYYIAKSIYYKSVNSAKSLDKA